MKLYIRKGLSFLVVDPLLSYVQPEEVTYILPLNISFSKVPIVIDQIQSLISTKREISPLHTYNRNYKVLA